MLTNGAPRTASKRQEAARRPARAETNPRKELVREELIDKAAEIFNVKGYAQTSMNDIATAVGLGRSAIYHYFRGKEEILSALIQQEAMLPSDELQALAEVPGLSATQRLRRAIVEGIVRRLGGGMRYIVMSRLETDLPADIQILYNQSRRRIFDHYSRFIADGIASGEFANVDVKITAFAVIGMANWTSRWFSHSGNKSAQEIAEIIADFALSGLRKDSRDRGDIDTIPAAVELLREDLALLERLAVDSRGAGSTSRRGSVRR